MAPSTHSLDNVTTLTTKWFFAICLVSMSSVCSAQPIAEVVRAALNKHPRMQEAQAAIRAAESDVSVASSALNPRVSLDGSVGAERYAAGSGSLLAVSPTIRVTKLLMDGGRVDRDVDIRTAKVRQAAANLRIVEEDLALQVALDYVQLAQAKDALSLARRWVSALASLEDMTREIAQIDPGRRVDRATAGSRLSGARAQLASRQGAVAEAAQQLNELVAAQVYVETPVSLTFRVDTSKAPATEHPRAQFAQAQAEAAKAQLQLDSLYDKPRFDIEGYVGSGRNRDGKLRLVNQGGVRLLGSLNVFDGGAGKATAEGSRHRLAQAETAVEGAMRDIRVSLARDLAAQEGAAERQAAYSANARDSEELRSMMVEQFKAGRRPLLDLLTQEAEIYQSGLAQSQELYDSLATQVRIAHERGELLAAFGIPSATLSRN